jgi:hypothetical protein
VRAVLARTEAAVTASEAVSFRRGQAPEAAAPLVVLEAVVARLAPAASVELQAWDRVAEVAPVAAVADAGNQLVMEAEHMTARKALLAAHFLGTAFLVCTLVTLSNAKRPAENWSGTSKQPGAQRSFVTPQKAVEALITAAEDYDVPDLLDIFGPDGESFVSSADPVRDKSNARAFAAMARQKNSVAIDPAKPNKAIVVVGNDDWPLPVPIVKRDGRWFFDSKAGRKEILYRRIGANELDAIQVCRGYVEAQREYASTIHDDSGVNQYAQRIMSSPGKQDGLYWRNQDGTPGGPISEAVARAIEEGYSVDKQSAYHGYYFKILKGQGPAAPMGRLDYAIEGIMIGGFALVAVPAEYGVTGVKTFIVSNDGIVYQKDLGPKSLDLAKQMELYNPDKTWQPTGDGWPPADSAETTTNEN